MWSPHEMRKTCQAIMFMMKCGKLILVSPTKGFETYTTKVLRSPLKMDGWRMKSPFKMDLFRGHVSFGECIIFLYFILKKSFLKKALDDPQNLGVKDLTTKHIQ